MISVRPAIAADAEQAVTVLRAAITKSCAQDHQNDPAILERWLSNKQPPIFVSWLEDPMSSYLVALENERVLGVSGAHHSGELRLCYVDPGVERRGVGSALLHAVEAALAAKGLSQVMLKSSATARGFYERHGYLSSGAPTPVFNSMLAYPYAKALAP